MGLEPHLLHPTIVRPMYRYGHGPQLVYIGHPGGRLLQLVLVLLVLFLLLVVLSQHEHVLRKQGRQAVCHCHEDHGVN